MEKRIFPWPVPCLGLLTKLYVVAGSPRRQFLVCRGTASQNRNLYNFSLVPGAGWTGISTLTFFDPGQGLVDGYGQTFSMTGIKQDDSNDNAE